MPVFKYTAKTRSGTVQKGEIEATDRNNAVALLRQRQLVVTGMKAKPKDIEINLPGMGGIKEKDIVVFTRQFATMIEAGLPLVQCLDILSRQAENKEFSATIAKVKTAVESGESFADALRRHPKVFDKGASFSWGKPLEAAPPMPHRRLRSAQRESQKSR